MSRLTAPCIALGLALFVAACSSEPSSTSRQNGSGGASTGSGGTSSGGSSGTSVGNTGGSTPLGGSAGTSTGGDAGTANGGAAGSGAVDTGGQAGMATGGAPTGGAGMATGGSGATGAGTGPGPTLPEFVTSAPNDYWNTRGTLTAVTSGTASVTLDQNTKYQRFTGFGGTFNEMGWDALSVLGAEDVTRALRLLFDANDGANFVYGRLPMGASDYAMSWYTLAETTNDYMMTSFSIARDREKLIPYIRAALAVRPGIKLWASPWRVPAWMMTGSNMRSDADTLRSHALYMARFVEEYAKEGLPIVAIHPQNEPGYASVHWTQALFIDFIKTYLGPTFAQRNLTAEIWCGTMSKDPDDANIAKAAAIDADAMRYVKGFGVQWNLETSVATLAQKGPVWQTEHRCGNYNFSAKYWDQSRYSAQRPQNDHLYGEESWQLIRDWIVAGVNSYSAWNMVLDTVGMSLGNWPQNALLTVDRSTRTLNVTPAYYAFRHFSQYIVPGATRIGVTGTNDAVAFLNPDGSIVTEVYNKDASAKTTTVGVGGSLYRFDVPAHGWATFRVTP